MSRLSLPVMLACALTGCLSGPWWGGQEGEPVQGDNSANTELRMEVYMLHCRALAFGGQVGMIDTAIFESERTTMEFLETLKEVVAEFG